MCRPFAPAFVLLFLAACAASAAPPRPQAAGRVVIVDGTLAIVNVTVIDVIAGKPVASQTVIVKDDKIVAVGDAKTVAVKDGMTTIDGTGKFLMPGLWDMHVHLADNAMPGLLLRYGVTGVRHMYSPMRGIDLKPEDPAKERETPTFPRIVAARNLLDSTRTNFPKLFQRNIITADTEAEARDGVKELKKLGNDFVKIHSVLPRGAYFAAMKEARVQGLSVAGHVPFTVTAAEASDAGQLTIEHLDGIAVFCSKQHERHLKLLADFGVAEKPDMNVPWRIAKNAMEVLDPKRTDALFAKFVANGTWHTPTCIESHTKTRLGDPKALDPEVEKLLPPNAKILWKREIGADGSVAMPVLTRKYTKAELKERKELCDVEEKLILAMHKAQVKLLAGTDTPNVLVVPGLSLHQELEIFVKCGLTPAEAIRTATVNPAECLKLTDKHGSVAVGKLADLVLLSKDPIADIRNTTAIDAVIMGGRVVPRK